MTTNREITGCNGILRVLGAKTGTRGQNTRSSRPPPHKHVDSIAGFAIIDVLLRLGYMRISVAGILLVTLLSSVFAQNGDGGVDRLIVYKSERKLVLLSRGKELRNYKVALGSEPVGPKSRQGDHRTPEGLYVFDSRNPNSHYHRAFHISYPNARDIANAKKLGVSPGGDIMLHGLPKEYAGSGSRTSCMTGRTGASRFRTKRWMKFGD